MSSTIKNIIILVVVGGILFAVYFFFIRTPADETNLVSSVDTTTASGIPSGTSVPDQFLTLLLSVKNIKLDDAIFSDVAFTSLHDSSITLTPDGTEGRTNPFAQFGASDIVTPPVAPPAITTPPASPSAPVAPTTPPASATPVKGINQ